MSDYEKIKAIIFSAVDEFNLSQELEFRIEKKESEVLFSRAGFTEMGKLDSLSLVYFLVTVEEFLQKDFGNNFNLEVQKLIEDKEVQLKNIESLIGYIEKI
jgi:hypothetical protein